jgi:PBP1b-binding outer membrane lipoprotein LpoB
MKRCIQLLVILIFTIIFNGCLNKTQTKKVTVKKTNANSRLVKMPVEDVIRKSREAQESSMPKD